MSFFNKEPSNMSNQPWERSVLEKVALASIEEQKRARRWSICLLYTSDAADE